MNIKEMNEEIIEKTAGNETDNRLSKRLSSDSLFINLL